MADPAELYEILARGFAKLFGLRRHERPFETGQSVVAAVIAIGVVLAAIVALVAWLLAR